VNTGRGLAVKILVCLRQVADSADALMLDEGAGRLSPRPGCAYRMNRSDEFAMEEALLLNEDDPGAHTVALTVGPERASAVVKRALEMGAHKGVHIACGEDEHLAPWVTAMAIAAYAERISFDLLLTGVMAEDDMAGVTGQLVAAYMDLPCVTAVLEARPLSGGRRIRTVSEIENGYRPVHEIEPPAVLTIQTGINTPRYPTLTSVLRARGTTVEAIPIDRLLPPSRRRVDVSIERPEISHRGVFLEGDAHDKARHLVAFLRERSLFP
jgi:electron transfer flavoprotein beta subunit